MTMEEWGLLDWTGSKRKQKKTSEVEKWLEIWRVIYPGERDPPHPWAERTTSVMRPHQPPDDTRGFVDLFRRSLVHVTSSGNIQFQPGQEELMMDRLSSLVQRLYSVHTSLADTPPLVNNSSSSQTRTEVGMPPTPVLRGQNNRNTTTESMPSTMAKRHINQPMMMMSPNPGSLDLQPQFNMLPRHIPSNIPYEPHKAHNYMGNISAVTPSTLAGQSPLLGLQPGGFTWHPPDLDEWPGFDFMQTDFENTEIQYPPVLNCSRNPSL
ncbi:hypothetical protein F5B20DRAFT_559074, partial [Whalleya microplaca]